MERRAPRPPSRAGTPAAPSPGGSNAATDADRCTQLGRKTVMAVKIERGGWVLIFLIGVALVGYSLNRYGVVDFSKMMGSKSTSASGETLDASKPLLIPASSSSSDAEVRVRVK